uniref:WAT1-related protein n=1 Tax=Glycine max TaxID=3847 RepID=C6T6S7_SOYBN|nr:unknown [Glycine max]
MIITAALGSLVLAEQVHLGSIFGAILIVCGLYTVVWGKSKDRKSTTEIEKGESQELPIKNGTKSASDIFDALKSMFLLRC